MDNVDWKKTFAEVYQSALKRYQEGKTQPALLLTAAEVDFLKTLGATPQELFDFVDDFARYGEPSFQTALEITSLRRDYFLERQNGLVSRQKVLESDLPAKSDELAGIAWLPRIIAKAKAKLRGELPDELMYCCGGDRKFLQDHGLEAGEFLRRVRDANGEKEIIEYVTSGKSAAAHVRS